MSNQSANGVVFDRMDPGDFLHAVQRALALYRRPQDWLQLQRTGMRQSFSWDTAAAQYAQLYRSLLPLSTT